ncbi:hypothetical protein [Paraburkholderia sp. RCC_158]|uniref:hypothetical protein n=1 Tax=Paraburkholderia sp. RCC_158 TaxID=3239220 RepID=UPI003524CF6C
MTARNLTHGMTRNADGTPNRTYRIWFHMRNRCGNPKHGAFENYGGRGITVCERWQVFENFFADMGEAPDGMSIERERNNEGYGPGNCKWATTTEQNRNKRSNIKLTHAGKTMTLKEWAVELGLIDSTLRKRIANGWSVERAFETPTR